MRPKVKKWGGGLDREQEPYETRVRVNVSCCSLLVVIIYPLEGILVRHRL